MVRGQTKVKASGYVTLKENEGYMNESRPYTNESNLKNKMTEKGLKFWKILSITLMCTFVSQS